MELCQKRHIKGIKEWLLKRKEAEDLEIIKQTTKYKKWFFGHYHTDMALNEKDFCVFEKIMQIV